MIHFPTITAVAAGLPQANIDTDIIFPARFLLLTTKTGLAKYAFFEWRAEPAFVLNAPAYADTPILVCGDNFGCGSSREQAVWALREMGVRCIVSTGFGEIFHGNCFNNGILPIRVNPETLAALLENCAHCRAMTVDLQKNALTWAAGAAAFTVEPWRRDALLNGWDEIDIVAHHSGAAIDAFEGRQRAASPWLYDGD